jgi:hypothetical protein
VEGAPATTTHRAGAAIYSADSAWIVLAFGSLSPFEEKGVLKVLDRDTLRVTETIEIDEVVLEMIPTQGPIVALAQEPGSIVRYIDVTTGSMPAIVHVAAGRQISRGTRYLAYLPSRDQVIGTTIGVKSTVHVLGESAGWIAAAATYERTAEHGAVTAWPHGLDLALVGLLTPGYVAEVALFDTEHVRFLPGMTRVGTGMITAMDTDAGGNAWLLLPYTAHLVRVAPRSE